LNPRPTAYEAVALTAELSRQGNAEIGSRNAEKSCSGFALPLSAFGLFVAAALLFALFEFALAPVFDATAPVGVFAANRVGELLVYLNERRGVVGLQAH